jgi:hypothetical protein
MPTERESSDKHYNTFIREANHPIWSSTFSEEDRREQFREDLETSAGVVGLITGVASLGIVMVAIALTVILLLL